MKIYIVCENIEEIISIKRLLKFYFKDIEIYSDVYNLGKKDLLSRIVKEKFDIVILFSHYEEHSETGKYLIDFGLQSLRSKKITDKIFLILFEKIEKDFGKDLKYILKIPFLIEELIDRIKYLYEHKTRPTDDEIKELNKVYPPIEIDHHHRLKNIIMEE